MGRAQFDLRPPVEMSCPPNGASDNLDLTVAKTFKTAEPFFGENRMEKSVRKKPERVRAGRIEIGSPSRRRTFCSQGINRIFLLKKQADNLGKFLDSLSVAEAV